MPHKPRPSGFIHTKRFPVPVLLQRFPLPFTFMVTNYEYNVIVEKVAQEMK